MRIVITKSPRRKSRADPLDLYRAQCPICGDAQDHGELVWRAARSLIPQDRDHLGGVEELDLGGNYILNCLKYRKFKCHTCGCEWKVRK